MQELWTTEYLVPVLILIGVTVALTVFIFRRRLFDRGYRKGAAKDPEQVRRDNPPDEWSKSKSR
ncbi:MAG: hypothetical protein DIU71_00050 [Proteobacteria bacterium]|nr:MAG: hypothetical protein DIU71_00050 [Pseudomonadota bacterium]